jgi:hypothetical protein
MPIITVTFLLIHLMFKKQAHRFAGAFIAPLKHSYKKFMEQLKLRIYQILEMNKSVGLRCTPPNLRTSLLSKSY